MFAESVADVRIDVALANGAVDAVVVAGEIAAGAAEREFADGVSEGEPRTDAVVAAAFESDGAGWLRRAAFGDDVDDAADGLGTVERALRAAENFNPLDIVHREVGEIEGVVEAVVDPDAVNENERVFRVGAAREHGDVAARLAALGDAEAGHFAQGVADRADLLALGLGPFDDGDGSRRVFRLRRNAGGRDNDFRQAVGIGSGRQDGYGTDGEDGQQTTMLHDAISFGSKELGLGFAPAVILTSGFRPSLRLLRLDGSLERCNQSQMRHSRRFSRRSLRRRVWHDKELGADYQSRRRAQEKSSPISPMQRMQ